MTAFLTILLCIICLIAIGVRQENIRTKKEERKWYDL